MTSKSSMTLHSMLSGPVGAAPDRVCIVEGERTWTRAQVRAAAGEMAASLRAQGLSGGDRVVAVVDHDARGVFFLAAASAMGLRLLMPYNLREAAVPEWLGIVDAATPDAVVYLKHDRSALAELTRAGCRVVDPSLMTGESPGSEELIAGDPTPSEHFIVLFTSGTTGSPKAISISEELVCRRVESVTGVLRFDATSRVFMSGLLNNTTGIFFSFGALHHDALLLIPVSRDVTAWPALVASQRATHIMLRPVAMRKFVDTAEAAGADLTSLRVVAYGAAAMPRALLARGRALMPCDWVQGYGLSETFGPFCWLDELAHREHVDGRNAYRVGTPDHTAQVRIDPIGDEPSGIGEVLVGGSGLMEGYIDIASGVLSPPDGWLRTGDLGCWSESGELLLKGRRANSLLSANGHRIYPEEVEAVFSQVPGVDDAVLVGIEASDGAAARPVVCLSGTLAARAPADIRIVISHALDPLLSREKWPDYVYAVGDAFPKSGNDKVLRAVVADRIDKSALIEL